ncbi:hypothetical protein GIB67_015464 [Kingdonia uniflora]|uniref:Uncharacterized protein n=1 Tax=Kingdonia uniflora TaxID=39325 RepID=A0A7J7LA33_9MAGN|nr:hypothetical protein GIB67_015464 [Kingdonia uniflora]
MAKFLSSGHALTAHFIEAIDKKDNLCGLVPVSILAACDLKLNNLCKAINHKSESNILLNVSFIMRAASLSGSVGTSDGKFSIHRKIPYSPETIQALISKKSSSLEDVCVEAILIPCSMEKPVETVSLNVCSDGYYMDTIAEKLDLADTSSILVSRIIGKASSEVRLYFPAPEFPYQLDSSLEVLLNGTYTFEASLNQRACYFSGQDIYGDAILASLGYKWKSTDLYHEDVSLGIYYRMLVGRLPDGGYKLSRKAILAGELPASFTTRSNWRGSFPRDLLSTFCRVNGLSEPDFSTGYLHNFTTNSSLKIPEKCNKLKKVTESFTGTENVDIGAAASNGGESVGPVGGTFTCEVKIYSKAHTLLLECSPEDSYRKQGDAIQNCALKVLLWFKKVVKQLHVSNIEEGPSSEIVRVYPHNLSKAFALCVSVHAAVQNSVLRCLTQESNRSATKMEQDGVYSLNIDGPDSGVSPSKGLLVCISYAVSLLGEGGHMKEILENNEEFEFEIGTDAVISQLEVCVTQMSMNQSAYFITDLSPQHFILAAARDTAKAISLLSSLDGCENIFTGWNYIVLSIHFNFSSPLMAS